MKMCGAFALNMACNGSCSARPASVATFTVAAAGGASILIVDFDLGALSAFDTTVNSDHLKSMMNNGCMNGPRASLDYRNITMNNNSKKQKQQGP